MPSYHTQQFGDQWFIAGSIGEDTLVEQADGITLWDGDLPVATVEYRGEPGIRGTYEITLHYMPADSFTEDDLTGWRDWRSALEFATGTKRAEWDNDT